MLTRRDFLKLSGLAMTTIYLPIFMTASLDPAIGAQVEGAVDPRWIVPGRGYQMPISWRDYDARQAMYDDNARLLGAPLTLTVKCVPPAYRLWPEWASSPPDPAAYPALVTFCRMLIDRYHPARLELFNEPNVGQQEAQDYQDLFGAWIGPGEAAHVAGMRYGAMLASVYPGIKAHSPQVQVVAGALMRNGYMLDFVDGMSGAPADMLSMHFYMQLETADFRKLTSTLDDLRRHTTLPLAVSETSILDETDSPALEQRQADWLRFLCDNRLELGLEFVHWYTLSSNGWLNSDLAPGSAWDVFRS